MTTTKRLVAAALFAAVFAAVASAQDAAPSPAALVGLTPEQTLSLANQWGMQAEKNGTTIWTTSKAFTFTFADGTKTVIAMPEDRMEVSIAPYIMKTHPCSAHYPTSCRGELSDTPIHLVAVTADGKTLLDEKTTTLPNGFVDLWLPRDLKIDVTIKARGLKVTERIGTFDSDVTCVTTPKLHY
ncbi:MAG TPA: CueP family metal-binding protein [Spirochaetia bacterium]